MRAQSSNFRALTESQVWQAEINRLESVLKGYDVKAASDLGNVGRDVQQLKPIFDILRGFIRPR